MEFGLAAHSGIYNTTELDGVKIDVARYLHLVVTDGAMKLRGFRLAAETALAFIDVPPGLEGLFAERQWGATIEASRTLRQPIVRAWESSMLSLAARAEAVDLDRAVAGDSHSRVSLSLNLRHQPWSVVRFGWYYGINRDRFNNDRPVGGLTASAASYF